MTNSIGFCANEHNKFRMRCMYSWVHSCASMTIENNYLYPIYAGPLFYLTHFEE